MKRLVSGPNELAELMAWTLLQEVQTPEQLQLELSHPDPESSSSELKLQKGIDIARLDWLLANAIVNV